MKHHPKVQQRLLACMPDPGDDPDFTNTKFTLISDKMREVEKSPLCRAGTSDLQGEVRGIIGTIEELSKGRSPRDVDMQKLCPLAKQILKKAEDSYVYARVVYEGSDKGKLKVGKKEMLMGGPAILQLYRDTEQRMKDGVDTDLEDIKPLRQFRWVLNDKQKAQVQEWVRTIAKQKCGATLQKAILNSTETKNLAIVPRGSASASSSSSKNPAVGLDILAQSNPQILGPKQQAKMQMAASTKQNIMKQYFTPRARVP